MKKQFILLAAALISSGAVFSQVSVGAKAGLNYSFPSTSFEDETPEDWENPSGIGFHVGGFADIGISDNFSVRPELLYSARSVKSSGSISFDLLGVTSTTEWDETDTYNYLEIPILANIGLGESAEVHIGPSFNMLMGGKASGESTTTVQGVSTSEDFEVTGSDFTDETTGLDIGLVIGGAINMENGLSIGLRYQRGLTSLEEDPEEFGSTTNWNVIQFSIGYLFMNGN